MVSDLKQQNAEHSYAVGQTPLFLMKTGGSAKASHEKEKTTGQPEKRLSGCRFDGIKDYGGFYMYISNCTSHFLRVRLFTTTPISDSGKVC